jgi:hydroxyacylglutathione hydrolase
MNIKTLTCNPFQENTYILWSESKDAIIVDPGCLHEKEEIALKRLIESEKLEVRYLVNTHLHLDHIFGNRFVERTWNVGTSACKKDEFWLQNFNIQCKMFGIEEPVEAPHIAQYLAEGDFLLLGTERIDILEIPGHSPGSLVLYDATGGNLIAGDVLFQGSIGRTDLNGGDYDQLIDNIQRKLLVLPDQTVVYPGHGSKTTIGNERKMNPFL